MKRSRPEHKAKHLVLRARLREKLRLRAPLLPGAKF